MILERESAEEGIAVAFDSDLWRHGDLDVPHHRDGFDHRKSVANISGAQIELHIAHHRQCTKPARKLPSAFPLGAAEKRHDAFHAFRSERRRQLGALALWTRMSRIGQAVVFCSEVRHFPCWKMARSHYGATPNLV